VVGLRNLRDVGGVPAAAGRRVAYGRLYRSDAPIVGDPDPNLRPWPPRTVIDLRSPRESDGIHPLASPHTRVVTVPLFGALEPARAATETDDLPTAYRRLLRSSAGNLIAVLRAIAAGPTPVLLHCAAGKDRTGVATAVALAAVGVAPDAIIADYLRTEASLDGMLDRLALGWSEEIRHVKVRWLSVERPDLMAAPPAAIQAVLESLGDWPDATRGWLRAHGLTECERRRLIDRLTAPDPA
jgi:hypothetical protein